MQKQPNQTKAKNIIKKGISENIDFVELRKRLPDMKKRPIMSLVFDVMEESDIKQIPFPGMVVRPRLTRKPLPVEQDGTLNILEILKEKGFDKLVCEAHCHVGKDKITLTIKPLKNSPVETKTKECEEGNLNIDEGAERMDFSSY